RIIMRKIASAGLASILLSGCAHDNKSQMNEYNWSYSVLSMPDGTKDKPIYNGFALDFDRDWKNDAISIYDLRNTQINEFTPQDMQSTKDRLSDGLANFGPNGIKILASERYKGYEDIVREDFGRTLGIKVNPIIPVLILE